MDYQYGYLWSPRQHKLVPGTAGVDTPWPDDIAQQVFAGDLNSGRLGVLKGSLGAPEAMLNIQNEGRLLKVEFFNDDFLPVLEYKFFDYHIHSFVDGGLVREGCLMLTSAQKITYTGDKNRYGVANVKQRVRRHFRNDGRTVLRPFETEWSDDPVIDMSAEGYWEPEAVFGDWDRWFVRDRPGVELFD